MSLRERRRNANPKASPRTTRLLKHRSPRVRSLMLLLQSMLQLHPSQVPPVWLWANMRLMGFPTAPRIMPMERKEAYAST